MAEGGSASPGRCESAALARALVQLNVEEPLHLPGGPRDRQKGAAVEGRHGEPCPLQQPDDLSVLLG